MNRREFLISSVAVGALVVAAPGAFAQDKLTILGSIPSLSFPFFVHMLNQIKARGRSPGRQPDRERRPEFGAQADRRHRSGDRAEGQRDRHFAA